MSDIGNMEPITSFETKLPDELAAIVTPLQLQLNEAALLADAPEVKQATLEAARQRLASFCLIHATVGLTGFEQGIFPNFEHVKPGEDVGMTFVFDRSLGLDKCVFFNWPMPKNVNDYKGATRILVSSRLLLDARCFVTPRDIYECARSDEDEDGNQLDINELSDEDELKLEAVYEKAYDGTYQELENASDRPFDYDGVFVTSGDIKAIKQRVKQKLHNLYFAKVVSGRAWLEFVARKLAAEGPDSIPLGEIKFTGTVPPDAIEGIVDGVQFEKIYLPHVRQTLALQAQPSVK